MNTQTMFSSAESTWETPQDFFDKMNKRFKFTVDVCATESNAKCEKYFTPEMDGLSQKWKGVCWMNPPYGREIGHWIKKAYDESESGSCTVVALLPSRTDTKWFHDHIYMMRGVEIEFIKGRLKFGKATSSAPFPSMIVIFNRIKK